MSDTDPPWFPDDASRVLAGIRELINRARRYRGVATDQSVNVPLQATAYGRA